MRYDLAVAVGLAVGLSAAAEEKPADDARRVQGSWDWDPAAKQSDARPKMVLERVVIKGDTLTFHYNLDGKRFVCPTAFTLGPRAAPRAIDFTPTDDGNANKGKAYLGLYDIKDGKLRICYRGPGSTRPRDFTDKSAGNDVTTFIALVPSPADE